MKTKNSTVLFLFGLFINISHLFKINDKIVKCLTKENSKGYCREKVACVGATESLEHNENCPKDLICCPRRHVSKKKCYEYSKTVFSYDLFWEGNNVISDECGILSIPLIIGGEKSDLKEFPHMAILGYKHNESSELLWNCGGSLISELFILTAAHCCGQNDKEKQPKVVKLGAANINLNDKHYVQQRIVKDVIVHPYYKRITIAKTANDIALLKMNKKVKFTPYVRPTCLDYRGVLKETRALATGFGFYSQENKRSPDLLKVVLDISDKDACQDVWKYYYENLPDEVLCAGSVLGGKDTCNGDSGGPLQVIFEEPYCMFRQIAITSQGLPCGGPNSHNLYTRVFSYIPWIEHMVWPGEM